MWHQLKTTFLIQKTLGCFLSSVCSSSAVADSVSQKQDADVMKSDSNLPTFSDNQEFSDSDSNSNSSSSFELNSDGASDQAPNTSLNFNENLSYESNSIPMQISNWAVNHNITQVALTSLLKILKPAHPELPVDARSLLKTCREVKFL